MRHNRQARNAVRARTCDRHEMSGRDMVVWGAGLLLALLLAAAAAQSQQPAPEMLPPQADNTTSVIKPPAGIDPGIQKKPPMPASSLPTMVIPPPGTPGGSTGAQPK